MGIRAPTSERQILGKYWRIGCQELSMSLRAVWIIYR